jgi:hypothetical protein
VREIEMSTVIMQAVVSVDGYLGYDNDPPGHLFDRYGNGNLEVQGAQVSQTSADYIVDSGRQRAANPVQVRGIHHG